MKSRNVRKQVRYRNKVFTAKAARSRSMCCAGCMDSARMLRRAQWAPTISMMLRNCSSSFCRLDSESDLADTNLGALAWGRHRLLVDVVPVVKTCRARGPPGAWMRTKKTWEGAGKLQCCWAWTMLMELLFLPPRRQGLTEIASW